MRAYTWIKTLWLLLKTLSWVRLYHNTAIAIAIAFATTTPAYYIEEGKTKGEIYKVEIFCLRKPSQDISTFSC